MPKKNSGVFNASYTDYWRKRTRKTLAGAKVPDTGVAGAYIQKLRISGRDKVLDLACGYGRLHSVISQYSQRIVGVDISSDMLAVAAANPYSCLIEGQAEDTHIAANSIDKVVFWAAFDVVDQEHALVEVNRILKKDGQFLVTGKNYRYRADDKEAFIAERNALLKKFSNHFTDTEKLLKKASAFGFKVLEAYAFEKRGDFGANHRTDLLHDAAKEFYEYILILKKVKDVRGCPLKIAHTNSKIAALQAARNGFKGDIKSFFRWHKNQETKAI